MILTVDMIIGCHWCRNLAVVSTFCADWRTYASYTLIDKRQYGFRENHSTDLAITTIYDELLKNSEQLIAWCSWFLDLSKTFNYCDHEILLDKRYHQRRSRGGGWRGSSPPLSNQNIDVYFLSYSQHCKSRSGVLQNVLRQYHKA